MAMKELSVRKREGRRRKIPPKTAIILWRHLYSGVARSINQNHDKMAKNRHYSPVIDRFLVKVLYFDARNHGIPMTKRVDELLRDALKGSEAWSEAEESRSDTEKTQSGSPEHR